MKKPLPPVPARTEPELRAFLEALRASIKTLEERGVTVEGLKKAGAITAEQAERLSVRTGGRT